MKVGSLVVVKPLGDHSELIKSWKSVGIDIKWLPSDDEKTIYTIRKITESNGLQERGALLEEGIIGQGTKEELEIKLSYLREVQPPISSEEIAELVEDACCVEKS